MNARVKQALAGVLCAGELTGDEQEEFFEGLAAAMWAPPSAHEREFWADRERRGLGVGMDDAGNLVFPAVIMPAAPTTMQ